MEEKGFEVIRLSNDRSRLLRLVGIVASVLRPRHAHGLAQVDVSSGLSIPWAEVAELAQSRLGKFPILTLHGGGFRNPPPGTKDVWVAS